MNRKRLIITAVVVVVLVVLIIFQAHAYRKFDWSAFAQEIAQVNWWMVLGAAGLVHRHGGLLKMSIRDLAGLASTSRDGG